jgi:glycosyltransferase involved in cell wall biosynthesis|tara:strand:+ start:1068 stop:2165 length:1098 start_codon:yes stop_codon:yes gene_type:complete
MKKIKVAFIKFGGMANGGTEKVLQTIASELPKDQFIVDYFYCDSAPYIGSDFVHPDTDPSRVQYVKDNGVNVIKFNVEFKDLTTGTHDWVNTNFWELFDEEKYDVIQTGRSGHPEYPFTLINKTPIVDSIHLSGMAENKHNTVKTVLISKEQKERWIMSGGPADKAEIIPNPLRIPDVGDINYREEFGWQDKFVFGLHQRRDNHIFSPIPLEAYDEIEDDNTAFLLLGGSENYQKQARDLGLKNFKHLPPVGELEPIHKFLNTLDVYAHGRSDGEQCSCAIIEAMSHGLPVISHTAPSMGQLEQIGDAGRVTNDYQEYSEVMADMIDDKNYYSECAQNSKKRYNEIYKLESIIKKYADIYKGVIS